MLKFTVDGEPASKANSRKLVTIRGKPAFIKSAKALAYLKTFAEQCPVMSPLITEDIGVAVDVWYASRRPDLDISLILDCMQGKIYENDRQVRCEIARGDVDPDLPRAEITIFALNDPGYYLAGNERFSWDE